MEIQFIATLASSKVELMFRAMERSLRKCGCDLPLRVIPFNDEKFSLPKNAEWWEDPELFQWLDNNCTSPRSAATMRKYLCLLHGGYQFLDTDAVFLRNPEDALSPFDGFVTCCCHWHNPGHTHTPDSRRFMETRTTTWQQRIFNSGQFACDRPLYDLKTLQMRASSPELRSTCLDFAYHEQPGVNLLVFDSKIRYTNLTLPPVSMQSSWAGDYTTANFDQYWSDPKTKPYLMHWAGTKPYGDRAIDQLFIENLEEEEKSMFVRSSEGPIQKNNSLKTKIKAAYRVLTE